MEEFYSAIHGTIWDCTKAHFRQKNHRICFKLDFEKIFHCWTGGPDDDNRKFEEIAAEMQKIILKIYHKGIYFL